MSEQVKFMKLKRLKSNKGFSLIEILVSFAIFGILCVALVGFITMSARSYKRTQEMINLQVEYQVVMRVLNEYIMDCNDTVEFNTNTGTLTIVNTDATHVFVFDEDAGSLFLTLADGNALVSRSVTAFSVGRVNNNDALISVNMGFTNRTGDRNYQAEQFIALRNSPGVIIDGTGGGNDDEDEEPDDE
jgi:prepilin-type N-terminal cleavage/methylation domain-containing protein